MFFPWFNRVFKGFRRGEFSIFTGPTGSGKTTFLSQYSLDFAMGGMSTLWCSFELKNEVLLSTMLNQYAGVDLLKEPHRFDYYADQFENIPLYFQTYFGSTHVDDVLTMIDYAVYTHDVGHVVIDNLQFMLSGQGRGIERFEMQDDVVAKLRKLATTLNIHITLVIHPRKGEEGADLNLSSIFGTAKSTQEADNVTILQRRDKYRVIDVKKNRYDGEVGRASVWFDRSAKRFEQINAKEIEELLTGVKIEDIISRKNREIKSDLITQAGRGESAGNNIVAEEHQSESSVTDDSLHHQLEEKIHPPKPKPFEKAFGKLAEIKLARERAAQEEPDISEVPDEIRMSVYSQEEDTLPESFTQPKRPKSKGQSDVEFDDLFGIKFEGDPNQVGISINVNSLNTGTSKGTRMTEQRAPQDSYRNQGSVQNQKSHEEYSDGKPDFSSTKDGETNQTSNLTDSQKRSALAGMAPNQNFETINNMYQEGAILFTYSDMFGDIDKKIQYKTQKYKNYNDKREYYGDTNGQIKYDDASSKKQSPEGQKKQRAKDFPHEDDN